MNKNILLFFSLFLIILLFFSCSNHRNKTEELNIINDVFLQVVGTDAYKYNSLRPAPPLNSANNKSDTSIKGSDYKFFIILSDTLRSLRSQKKSTESFFNEHQEFNNFRNIVERKFIDDNNVATINISDITNTGKYELISSNKNVPPNVVIVGEVGFSRVAYNKDFTEAALLVTISTGKKAGLTKLVLLFKRDKWIIKREEIIEIW